MCIRDRYFDGTINQFVGRAYLYNRSGNNWNYEATIASAACYGLNFGFDVKISGNQGLISSPTAYTNPACPPPVSYTHLRAHETVLDIVCRLLLEKNKTTKKAFGHANWTKIHIFT